jgi:hypothetical protein
MVGEKRLSPESRVSQAILMAVNSFTQAPPVLRPGQTGINYNLLPAPPASQRNAWTDSIMSHDSVESSPGRVFLPTESLHFTQPMPTSFSDLFGDHVGLTTHEYVARSTQSGFKTFENDDQPSAPENSRYRLDRRQVLSHDIPSGTGTISNQQDYM